ncbi:MAG: recombination protein RecR [Bacilli bacterium]|nr:recombination protein RecR [Bacilli bacterium]
MKEFSSIAKLIDSFQRLPGIGHKTAEKMAYQVLEMKDENVEYFADALREVKSKIHHCPICGAYTEDDICEVCANDMRDKTKIMVVSYPKDVIAFEKIGAFDGVYHVLGGALSSVNGVTINDLNVSSLFDRIQQQKVSEVIVATPPNTEGETTALYLARILANTGVNVTRIAYGLPLGGHLEYADALTLTKALEGRNKI